MVSHELTTGVWKIAEKGGVSVVIEVYPQVAYAYLYDRKKGILSHVWLFNCQASIDMDFVDDRHIPQAMDASNISEFNYKEPENVADVSCVYNIIDKSWDIYWSGKKMACLFEGRNIGASSLVRRPTKLAAMM